MHSDVEIVPVLPAIFRSPSPVVPSHRGLGAISPNALTSTSPPLHVVSACDSSLPPSKHSRTHERTGMQVQPQVTASAMSQQSQQPQQYSQPASPSNNDIVTLLQKIAFSQQRTEVAIQNINNELSDAKSQSSAALTAVHELSNNTEQRFKLLEEKFESLKLPSSTPPTRSQSLPPLREPIRTTDNIEAVIFGFPKRLRSHLVDPLVKNILDITSDYDPTFMQHNGPWCRNLIFRFADMRLRRDFIHTINDSDLLKPSFNGATSILVCKSVQSPEDNAATICMRKGMFYFKNEYKDDINTYNEIIPDYRNRELCLFSTPIIYYIDDKRQQLFTKHGGTACVDKSMIAQLSQQHNIKDMSEAFAAWIVAELPDVTIVVK